MEVSCLALVVLCSVKVEGSGAGVWRVDPETLTNWDPLGTISGRSDEVVSFEIVNFPASVLVTLFVVVEHDPSVFRFFFRLLVGNLSCPVLGWDIL